MNLPISERACAARILIAITVHFDVTRLQFLAEVLRSLSDFPVATMNIILVTNTFREEDIVLLKRLCGEVAQGKDSSIRSYGGLSHPFDLTWCHKEIIASEFLREPNSQYTHFIYLEDDMRINFSNFCYFMHYRDILRKDGLIPSFLRVEYSANLDGFINTDNLAPTDLSNRPCIDVGDAILVNMLYPYNACYILDVELAAEYVKTRSFDMEDSKEVSAWQVRERAAMGLCFENIPAPFQCRYVVPVLKQSGVAPAYSWISHIANNYADNPNVQFGKIRMDSLFTNGGSRTKHGEFKIMSEDSRTQASSVREEIIRKLWRGMDPYHGFPKKLIGFDLQGWNSNHPFLTETIVRDRPQIIVELGVWKGASTVGMAKQLQASEIDGAIIAVDTWLGSTEHWVNDTWFDDLSTMFGYPQIYYKFMENVIHSGVEGFIVPLPIDSMNACNLLTLKEISVDMIHLDASHHYEAVLLDLQMWWSRLRSGGILVGDDYYPEGHWPGVKRAVDEFLSVNPHRDFESHQGKCRAIKL